MFQPRTVFLITACITFITCSCIKKYGCTDYAALNHDFDVDYNDNSCVYSGSGVFYWKKALYNGLFVDSGATYVSVYLDDVFIGADSTIHHENSLNCFEFAPIRFQDTIYFTQQKKQLKVIDQNQNTLINKAIVIVSGCESYEIYE